MEDLTNVRLETKDTFETSNIGSECSDEKLISNSDNNRKEFFKKKA